jgi:uncharacterized membrane protein
MMMIVWLVGLVVIIWIARTIAQRGGFGSSGGSGENKAEALLRERYARGEIDDATYRRMLDDLRR